jgi:hypothetical protein
MGISEVEQGQVKDPNAYVDRQEQEREELR